LRPEAKSLHHGLSCSSPCPATGQGDIGPDEEKLRDKSLAHPLRTMTGERVRDFMTQDSSETGFVFRDGEDPRIHGDLASREGKGVHGLVILDDGDFPMKLPGDVRITRLFRRGDDPIRNPLNRLDLMCIARDLYLGILKDLLIGLGAKLLFIALGQDQKLPTLRVGIRGTARQSRQGPEGEPNCRHRQADSPRDGAMYSPVQDASSCKPLPVLGCGYVSEKLSLRLAANGASLPLDAH